MSIYVKKTDVLQFKTLLDQEHVLYDSYKKNGALLKNLDAIYTKEAKIYAKELRIQNENLHFKRNVPKSKNFEETDKARLRAQKNWVSCKELDMKLNSEYWRILSQLNKLVGCSSSYDSWKFKSRI